MKILTRYLLKEFLSPLGLSLGAFSVIILIIRVFDEMRYIMEHRPGFWVAFKYFVLQVPSLLIQITPIAVLMAVLFSLGHLAKTSQLIAMRAGGAGILLVAKPLFFSGLVVGAAMILLNETLVPKTNRMYHRVKWEEMDKQTQPVETVRQNISVRGADNEIYHIGSYDGPHATMTDVLILGFGEGVHLKSRIDAKKAVYEDGQWVFYDGYLRVFDENDVELSAQAFNRTPIPLAEKPADFLKEQKEPSELSIAELAAYVRQLRRNGADCHKELVELHNKIAFPFGCVILAVLGVPWGWSMGKYSGVVLSFGICLAVAFIYIGGMQIGHSLGYSGVLSPFFSMWTANLIFAALGPYLLFRKNR